MNYNNEIKNKKVNDDLYVKQVETLLRLSINLALIDVLLI